MTPLKSMDKSGYVIYLSTFSKTVYPGLRLGWIWANKKLIYRLSNIRQLMDLHSSCISQLIVERFIASGEMEKYLSLIRREYRDGRDIMMDALKTYAPPGLTWNHPDGGYYLWCRLPEGLPADLLAPQAAAKRRCRPSGNALLSAGTEGGKLYPAELHLPSQEQNCGGDQGFMRGYQEADGIGKRGRSIFRR